MTEDKAVDILERWCRTSAVHRQKTVAILLFGITYAADLEGLDLKEVTIRATGYPWPQTVRSGMTLSRYVGKIETWPHWAHPRPDASGLNDHEV